MEAVLLERETFSPWQKLPRQQIVPRGGILLASLREKITPTPNKTAKEASILGLENPLTCYSWEKADHNERPQPAALTAHQGFPDDLHATCGVKNQTANVQILRILTALGGVKMKHNQGHSVKLEATDILYREPRWYERGVKEDIYERIYSLTLNRKGGLLVELSTTSNLALTQP
ncbi:hypothetical protein Bbelb_048950 [Branchiostoma belcheri]|nr:hypothetical protein Bbelb_048950 [Branchiostoma belcheri]